MKKFLCIVLSIYCLSGCIFDNANTHSESNTTAKLASTDFDFKPNPVEVEEQEVTTLAIGQKAPDFKLPGTDGKYHTLSEYDSKDVLAIIFTCNHCPTAQAYEERIKTIVNDYADKSVQVVAISPNSPLGLLYEELGYSDMGDDFEEMIIRAKDHGFNFPYLYDGDNQKVSLAYGPAVTPHCFVFDKSRTLKYVGRVDRSEKPGTANGEDLRAAIDQVLAGGDVAAPVTKTFGCSTKWGWKTKMRTKTDLEWANKDVTIQEVDGQGIKDIMANNSDKLRLVNVWATWCGPCRLEYPDFVVVQRMFGARDFEFISISADKIAQKDKALKFLEGANSALKNYISTIENEYDLVEVVDTEWNGALPYTALIEPGGRVVKRYNGVVDFQEMKKIIVDHPRIGRFF